MVEHLSFLEDYIAYHGVHVGLFLFVWHGTAMWSYTIPPCDSTRKGKDRRLG